MDKTSPTLIHDFTDEERVVANILANMENLRPLYEPPNLVPSTPSWICKRPRSELVSLMKSRPDRLKWDSVSGSGGPRNASPDSPLMLKSSPESCCVQGRSGPTRGEKGTRRPFQDGCKKDDDVDDYGGVIRSKKKLKKEAMGGRCRGANRRDRESKLPESDFPVQIDGSLALCGQPHSQLPISPLALAKSDHEASPQGSSRTSLTSPLAHSRPQFLFDLNLLPESTDAQSTAPYEKDRNPGQTSYNRAAAYDGRSQAETAKAARKRRLEICRLNKCGISKANTSSRHS